MQKMESEAPKPEPDDLSEWWIRVRPLPRDVPAHIRVRHFLKAALRAWGLKCEAIRAKPPEDVDRRDRSPGDSE